MSMLAVLTVITSKLATISKYFFTFSYPVGMLLKEFDTILYFYCIADYNIDTRDPVPITICSYQGSKQGDFLA